MRSGIVRPPNAGLCTFESVPPAPEQPKNEAHSTNSGYVAEV
jgi:hypothetical protein